MNITFISRNLLTEVAFKNCASFIKCITKVVGITIDGAADLDLVMPMYNLLEYSWSYSDTASSLWFCSKDEATNFNDNVYADENAFKSFQYEVKLLGKQLQIEQTKSWKTQQLLYC